jgi:hypothetical protein
VGAPGFFLRNFARSRRILALRLAAVKSLSTCSSRFIRSTIAAVLFGTLVALIIASGAAPDGNELTPGTCRGGRKAVSG